MARSRVILISVLVLLAFTVPASATDLPASLVDTAVAAATAADAYNVELVGHFGGLPGPLAIQGDYIYVGFGSELVVLDISDRVNPRRVGGLMFSRIVRAVAVADNYAYVAVDRLGFWVVDVSSPANPTIVGSYPIPPPTGLDDEPKTVAVMGHYAYVTDTGSGLWVMDISNPTNPTPIGFYSTPGGAHDVAVANNRAYVVTGGYYLPEGYNSRRQVSESSVLPQLTFPIPPPTTVNSLRIADVSNPANPTEIGVYETTDYIARVAVAGSYAYIIDDDGFKVMDVSNPTNPSVVAAYNATGGFRRMAAAGNYVYLAWFHCYLNQTTMECVPGLRILDISNPLSPTEVGFYVGPTGFQPLALSVAVADNYIYTAMYELYILRFGSTASGRVIDSRGVPFAGVQISAGTGLTATTDANGEYTITKLISGTYTLTPTLTGYTFWPVTRTVTVPPDVTGQSFVILAAPVSTTLTPAPAETITSLTYTDTQGLVTQLDFPGSAVTQTTTLVFDPLLVSGGAGFAFAGHAFELSVYQEGSLQPGFTFSAPVTVTVHYSDADVRVVTDESQLALWWWAGDQWRDATETCLPNPSYSRDLDGNALSVPICQVGRFGLLGPTHSGYFPLAFRDGS